MDGQFFHDDSGIVPPWMKVAFAEMGTAAMVGVKNTNPRVVEYLQTTQGHYPNDETPWCSAFVNWVMLQAGIKGTNLAAARSWLQWGKPLAKPEYGCITVFWRDDPKGPYGHVGFYLYDKGKDLSILGGNQSGKIPGPGEVNVSCISEKRKLSYRWPVPEEIKEPSHHLRERLT